MIGRTRRRAVTTLGVVALAFVALVLACVAAGSEDDDVDYDLDDGPDDEPDDRPPSRSHGYVPTEVAVVTGRVAA